MLGWGKTGTVHASATVSPSRSQETYQRYAVVALYRQALLNLDDPAPAGHVVGDPVVSEHALAAMPERGEDDARFRLAESVFRRSVPLAGFLLSGGLGYIRVIAVLGIHPREMAAPLRAVLRKLTTSPPAAEDGDRVSGPVPPAITGEAGRPRKGTACSGTRDINVAGRYRGPAESRRK